MANSIFFEKYPKWSNKIQKCNKGISLIKRLLFWTFVARSFAFQNSQKEASRLPYRESQILMDSDWLRSPPATSRFKFLRFFKIDFQIMHEGFWGFSKFTEIWKYGFEIFNFFAPVARKYPQNFLRASREKVPKTSIYL